MSRRYLSKEEQEEIIERAQSLCEYCLTPVEYAVQPFVFEYIIPISRDGETALDNLAYACGKRSRYNLWAWKGVFTKR